MRRLAFCLLVMASLGLGLGLACSAAAQDTAAGAPPAPRGQGAAADAVETAGRAERAPAGAVETAGRTERAAAGAVDAAAESRPSIAVFVDIGVQTSRLSSKIANQPGNVEQTDSSLHLGAGVRRGIGGGRGDLGVRLELDEIDSNSFLAVRALDYRRNLSERLAWTGFFGVARLALGTPAYGWYAGGGFQLKGVMPSWDLGIDVRYGDRLARDNILPTDPQGGSPDNFHSVYGASLYLSRRF
ncbi:MAG TPA: hypothetical protein VFV10_03770 [Gammaproteobacteria bacterium]|nr:hypothetical protein [Gammaproteobacteria bacterium]